MEALPSMLADAGLSVVYGTDSESAFLELGRLADAGWEVLIEIRAIEVGGLTVSTYQPVAVEVLEAFVTYARLRLVVHEAGGAA